MDTVPVILQKRVYMSSSFECQWLLFLFQPQSQVWGNLVYLQKWNNWESLGGPKYINRILALDRMQMFEYKYCRSYVWSIFVINIVLRLVSNTQVYMYYVKITLVEQICCRFYDKRDAEDALDAMDGRMLDGRELRVQMARYGRPSSPYRRSSRRSKRWLNLTLCFLLCLCLTN